MDPVVPISMGALFVLAGVVGVRLAPDFARFSKQLGSTRSGPPGYQTEPEAWRVLFHRAVAAAAALLGLWLVGNGLYALLVG